MATHSSTSAGRTSWTEEPGGLQSMGLQRIGHDWVAKHSTARCFSCVRPTLWDPVDYSLPSCSVHGIFQAIQEWVAISFSRGSSQPRDWTRISYVSCIGRWVLYRWCRLGSPGFAIWLLLLLFFFFKDKRSKIDLFKELQPSFKQLASRRVILYQDRVTPWIFPFNGIGHTLGWPFNNSHLLVFISLYNPFLLSVGKTCNLFLTKNMATVIGY